jgi:hypothetical protein
MLRITRNSASEGIKLLNFDGSTGVTGFSLKTLSDVNLIHFRNNGNIGIGTTCPSQKLEVVGGEIKAGRVDSSQEGGQVSFARASDNATGWYIDVFGSTSTPELRFVNVSAGSVVSTITGGGYLKVSNTGNYINAAGTYHEFNNSLNNTVTVFIRSHGTTNGSTILCQTPAADTSEYFFAGNSVNTTRVLIYTNGNIQNLNNSYGAISDIKLKENITDATPKLDDLLKVKVRNYNLIGEETKQIGVIAQELEEVFPAMVSESEDFEEVEVPQLDEEGNEILNEEGEVVTTTQRVSKGTATKSVKYSVFVPMLIKAIQELKTEIDSLKNQMQ